MSDHEKKGKRPEPERLDYLPENRVLGTGDDAEMRRRLNRMGRRAFLGFGAALTGAALGWRWLTSRPLEDDLPWPFRRALEVNERLARDYVRGEHLNRTYDPAEATPNPRVNGNAGLKGEFNPAAWMLSVAGAHPDVLKRENAADGTLKLSMEQIRKLPYQEMTTEFRCIEGWSQIVRWGGVRFSSFLAMYPPATTSGDLPGAQINPDDLPPYVSMETPDGGYYVGLDMESLMHPQTLLCYAMNGKVLPPQHGAPLRLIIPVKYGVKNIKRIGTITYTTRRPDDYWGARGYDWFAGL